MAQKGLNAGRGQSQARKHAPSSQRSAALGAPRKTMSRRPCTEDCNSHNLDLRERKDHLPAIRQVLSLPAEYPILEVPR